MRIEDLRRAFDPIWNALRSMVARAVVRNSNDAPRMQELQVDLGHADLRDKVERWQDYGFTSRPLDGAEALAICPAGERSLSVVISVEDRRYRVRDLEKGDVAIYTDEGVAIRIGRGRVVTISGASISLQAETISLAGSESITIQAPDIMFKS